MIEYFSGCKTLEEAKKRHRQLLLKYHPDMMNRITREILSEWEQVQKNALPDGSLPQEYHVAAASEPKVVYRDREVVKEVPVERIVFQDRVVYRDSAPKIVYKTIVREVPIERVIEKIVAQIEYRDLSRKPLDEACVTNPDRYFVYHGFQFQPSLNERESQIGDWL